MVIKRKKIIARLEKKVTEMYQSRIGDGLKQAKRIERICRKIKRKYPEIAQVYSGKVFDYREYVNFTTGVFGSAVDKAIEDHYRREK